MSVVVNDRSKAALAEINRLSNTALVEFVETTVEIAKDIVKVDTGNLKDSIDSDTIGSAFARFAIRVFRIFTQTGYGAFVELGTARMERQPFLGPAISETIREFNDGGKWGT